MKAKKLETKMGTILALKNARRYVRELLNVSRLHGVALALRDVI